jgi:hypothetical protein
LALFAFKSFYRFNTFFVFFVQHFLSVLCGKTYNHKDSVLINKLNLKYLSLQ